MDPGATSPSLSISSSSLARESRREEMRLWKRVRKGEESEESMMGAVRRSAMSN